MIKNIFIFACVLTSIACTSQPKDEFTVKGKLDKPFTGTVYLGHIKEQFTNIDSMQLTNATEFSFTQHTSYPDKYRISFKPYRKGYEFIAEAEGCYELKNDSVTVIQGKEQELMNRYLETITPLRQETEILMNLYAEAEKAKDENALSELREKLTQHFMKEQQTTVNFIKSYPRSYTAIDLAGDLLFIEYPEWKEVYETVDTINYTYSYTFRSLQEKMNEARSLWMQDIEAPDFTTTDINGKTIKLSSFKGNYLLLDFWASWCKPCRDKAKEIKKIYPQLKAKGIQICGINLDDERKKWLNASHEDGILWINTSEQKSFKENQIAKDYKVTQIPALFVIDPSGKIVKQNPDIDYLLNLTTK